MRVTAPARAAGREAKEGRRESHKNIIAHKIKNADKRLHFGPWGFLGWGIAWQHAPLVSPGS